MTCIQKYYKGYSRIFNKLQLKEWMNCRNYTNKNVLIVTPILQQANYDLNDTL